MTTRKKKRRIMRALKLTEISAVDRPAQEGASMLLMKRADEDDVEKGQGFVDVLTSVDDGHQHGLEICVYDSGPHIYMTSAKSGDADSSHHSHEISRGPNGEMIVSENAGHSHTIDASEVAMALMQSSLGKVSDISLDPHPKGSVSVAALIAGTRNPVATGKSADDIGNQPTGDLDMADKNADNLSAVLAKRDEEIKRLQSVIDLTPAHRAQYEELSVSDRGSFLEKSAIDRDAHIEMVEKANPVVYTDGNGAEYRKNDDTRLIAIAKERDTDREEMAKFKVEADQARFAKQADDLLGLIPGEAVAKVALVRNISGIEDEETRKSAFAILEAANKSYRMVMSPHGVTDTTTPSSEGFAKASDLLDQAIQACASEDGISKADATNKVLGTQAGQALYAKARSERIATQAIAN